MHHVKPDASFAQAYNAIKAYFDTPNNQTDYYQEWTTVTLAGERQSNPGKLLVEVVDLMVEKLHLCQQALGSAYASDEHLIAGITRAYRKFIGRTNRHDYPISRQEYRRKNCDDAKQLRKSDRRCFICHRENCRSWKHSEEERREAQDRYDRYRQVDGRKRLSTHAYQTFLQEYEGTSSDEEDEDSTEEEVKQDVATAQARTI
ncbi:hypothetical protein TSTA_054690 [Talaromyces stipitatus ATCC 10500]|uniref:Uncharacterized protein n=1 Tax=Talaromyces stipitatus (strain ATCC 10500 / CBS 375.48 / QM 6759 / NRRL 1006) TaxID=441959 RepID=B8MR64_TALSN|nr:uncharacterized protein TSTA_054690 [Talaromyces stipitatus ATCC 10500]EED12959.1 hypothetical protein TSTA_054690 [Talaromyces stipitatus ATCC 10500]